VTPSARSIGGNGLNASTRVAVAIDCVAQEESTVTASNSAPAATYRGGDRMTQIQAG